MTPEQLRAIMTKDELETSLVAYIAGLDRLKLAAFLNGNVGALSVEEIDQLDKRINLSDEVRIKNREEQAPMLDGIATHLLRHSIHFQYEKNRKRTTASGTLVQIGDKLFVATCRHTVPQGTQFLTFIGEKTAYIELDRKTGNWSSEKKVGILGSGRHSSLDVGFIELEIAALQELEREAIGLASVSVKPQQYGRMATLLGFPFDFERETKIKPGVSYLGVHSLTFPAPVLAPEEWPNVPAADRQPEENVDVFMRYKRDDRFKSLKVVPYKSSHANISVPDQLPEVFGMSGGGIWQSWKRSDSGELWFPTDQELCAIQYGWHKTENYIRAVQARHWLELVADKIPSLSATIANHISTSQAEGS